MVREPRIGPSVYWCHTSNRMWRLSEAHVEQRDAPVLVEGVVPVAALGALHARGAAELARAAPDRLESGPDVAGALGEAELGVAGSAGVGVVDEDRGRAGLGVVGDRHPAQVPAVAD